MPNTGRITVCPFFGGEREKSISCEDAVRRFRFRKSKEDWMDCYCDKDWEKCQYAKKLKEIYEGGGDMSEHKVESLEKELRKISSLLTKCEKIAEARNYAIKELRRKNKVLEDRYLAIRKKLNEETINADKFYAELSHVINGYQERMCYILSVFADGKLVEAEFKEWSKGKEFILLTERDEKDRLKEWKAVVQEVKDGNNMGKKAKAK